MSKNSKRTSEPRLRFPEFAEEPMWELEELNDLGETVSGLTYSPDDVREEGLLVLRSSNIQNSRIVFDDCVYVDPKIKGANLTKPNDILICVRNGSKNLIGKNALIPHDLPLCTHGAFMSVFRAARSKFIFQLFQTDAYEKQVKNDLGATINSINTKNLLKYSFFIPKSVDEQDRIVSCLSSLDELISAQNDKVENLKKYKSGLLQQLFPQEGETIPRLRFPVFESNGNWEFLGGDKLFESITNKNHDGDLPILAITQEHGAIPRDMIDYSVIATEKSIKSYKIVDIGDFIISLRSFQGGIEYSQYKGICSPAYIILRKKIDLVSDFYRHYFKSSRFILDLNKDIEGIRDGKMVSYGQFSNIKIPFPKKQEQQKISNCLSSLEELINLENDKLIILKNHKCGLLQQMFPSPNLNKKGDN